MTNEEREQKIVELQDLRALEANPAWLAFAKELADKAALHAEAHESETLSPDKRAEHLHAMKELRALTGWLRRRQERLRAALNSAQNRR